MQDVGTYVPMAKCGGTVCKNIQGNEGNLRESVHTYTLVMWTLGSLLVSGIKIGIPYDF